MWDFKLGFTPNFWLHPLLNWCFARFTTLLAVNFGIPPYILTTKLWQNLYLFTAAFCLNILKEFIIIIWWDFFSKLQTLLWMRRWRVVSFKRDFSSTRSVEITTTIFCLSAELRPKTLIGQKVWDWYWVFVQLNLSSEQLGGCNMSIRFICCCCTRAHSRQIIID